MGWDASLFERSVEVFSTNYTHNTNRMMRVCGRPPGFFHRMFAHEAATHLGILISHLQNKALLPIYGAMEPFNGWGTRLELIQVLQEWKHACDRHPRARVEISL